MTQERRAASLFESATGCRYISTPKDEPALVDAVLMKGDQLVAVVETKCRDIDRKTFEGPFDNEWLITFEKVVRSRDIANALGVPLVGFLYLVKDDVLLVKRLSNPDGSVVPFRVETTETQATVNGGTATRGNAFIRMNGAKVYAGIKD